MKPQEVCAIIPAFNEAGRIGPVVSGVRAQGLSAIVVDDGSSDGTAAAAARAGAEVVSYKPNGGKGHALRKGIERFLADGRWAAAVFMDSDGQHDPADLPGFLRALDESEAVFGNRMADPRGMPFVRLWTNRVMSGIVSRSAGLRVPDTQCGYRALRREALAKLRLFSDRFQIESEIVLEAGRTKARVSSVPVRTVYGDEKSHIRPGADTVRFFKFLIDYRRRKSA